jgi:hypothetical protein
MVTLVVYEADNCGDAQKSYATDMTAILFATLFSVFFLLGQKFAIMEEKVVLASIIRHFHINSTQLTEDIKITPEIILKSTNGIMVKLETRNL